MNIYRPFPLIQFYWQVEEVALGLLLLRWTSGISWHPFTLPLSWDAKRPSVILFLTLWYFFQKFVEGESLWNGRKKCEGLGRDEESHFAG